MGSEQLEAISQGNVGRVPGGKSGDLHQVEEDKLENAPDQNPERKPAEDPTAIIESLRARLLFERNASKSAKQQVQQLARKVKELERSLEAEIQGRRRCEEIIDHLVEKLEKEGVKVDLAEIKEDLEKRDEQEQQQERGQQQKKSWKIKGESKRQQFTDVDNNGDHESVSSGSSTTAHRRVGRSCRTIRRRETSDAELDDQVKGAWAKVREDIIELAKLRTADTGEEGWMDRVMDMLENKIDEAQWSEEKAETESTSDETSQAKQQGDDVCSVDGLQHNEDQIASDNRIVNSAEAETETASSQNYSASAEAAATPSTSNSTKQEIEASGDKLQEEETQDMARLGSMKTAKSVNVLGGRPDDEMAMSLRSDSTKAMKSSDEDACAMSNNKWSARPEDDVEDILRALSFVKQQLMIQHQQQHFRMQQQPQHYFNAYSSFGFSQDQVQHSNPSLRGIAIPATPVLANASVYAQPRFYSQRQPGLSTGEQQFYSHRDSPADELYHGRLYADKLNAVRDLTKL